MTKHNLGKKLIFCKECNTKRMCKKSFPHQYWIAWTCSKGHYWKFKMSRAAEIVTMELDKIIPSIQNLFNRDNVFLNYLKRK